MNKLNSLNFVTVADTVRASNPSASVRANGKIMFSDSANKMIGYPKPERTFFKMGTVEGEENVVYLVPATEKDANTMRAAKNNDSFQFNNTKTIAALGMQPNTRYGVEEIVEGEGDKAVTFYKLTLKSKAEKDAEDSANIKAHVPAKTEGEIKAAMNRRTPLAEKPAPAAPTKKELAKAAQKQAKADFKAGK